MAAKGIPAINAERASVKRVGPGWHKAAKSASETRSRKVRRSDVANARFWNR
jgi:hypothetical protein